MAKETSAQNLEIELKVKIPDEKSLNLILSTFGEDYELIQQRNIYYDTSSRDLLALKTMFRIRKANDNWIATVKSKATQIEGVQKAIENEISLVEEPKLMETLSGIFGRLDDSAKLQGHDLIILGEINNKRRVYQKLDSEVFEIDHTIIAGHDFYEIEVETIHIEKVRVYLKELFDRLSIPFEYADSKYKRFLSFVRPGVE